jgi:hypothetical protein
MSTYLPKDVSTVLADVVRIMRNHHDEPCTSRDAQGTPCATCAVIERARQLAAVPSSAPDAALFAALEAAGAGDTVSTIVDHLEDAILLAVPVLRVDPRAVLRAVIVTAQQRLDWGYGPIGGAHAGATPWEGDQTAGVPDDSPADDACDVELAAALDTAVVAVEIEAETVAELRPAIDKARAVQLIVQHLRDTGWTT